MKIKELTFTEKRIVEEVEHRLKKLNEEIESSKFHLDLFGKPGLDGADYEGQIHLYEDEINFLKILLKNIDPDKYADPEDLCDFCKKKRAIHHAMSREFGDSAFDVCDDCCHENKMNEDCDFAPIALPSAMYY